MGGQGPCRTDPWVWLLPCPSGTASLTTRALAQSSQAGRGEPAWRPASVSALQHPGAASGPPHPQASRGACGQAARGWEGRRLGQVGLQGLRVGLLRDTCTSRVRVGVPEQADFLSKMGCPKWRADTPSHGGHPEWRAVASQLQPRVLGNGGLIVAHKGHFAKIGSFMCIVLSFQGGPLKKQALLQEAVCLDLACSPGGAPTPRPGRQGQRGRWRAGLGARGTLPFLGLAPHSPSEVRLVGPRVPRARGGGGWSRGRLRPASAPTPARGWPGPSPGPGPCQLTELPQASWWGVGFWAALPPPPPHPRPGWFLLLAPALGFTGSLRWLWAGERVGPRADTLPPTAGLSFSRGGALRVQPNSPRGGRSSAGQNTGLVRPPGEGGRCLCRAQAGKGPRAPCLWPSQARPASLRVSPRGPWLWPGWSPWASLSRRPTPRVGAGAWAGPFLEGAPSLRVVTRAGACG